MKLINISKTENSYLVKALIQYKIFGIQIGSEIKEFKKSTNDNAWYTLNGKKKASKGQRLKLEKWLKDHQKFIEKN